MKKTGNHMNLKRFFFISMVLLGVIPAIAFCMDVSTQVDKRKISKEDTVFLKVVVDGGEAELDFSMVKDFKVISRGSSSSYHYINGKSERKATYNFVLVPLSTGELKISVIKAIQGSEIGFTREIVIHVSDRVVETNDIAALFAKAEITNPRLFVGQQTVYTLKFFTSKKLSGVGFETPPVFNGFSSKLIEKEKSYTLNIKGVLYNVFEVNYIIIPNRPGTFKIDPAVLIANVIEKSKRDPRFDSFFNDSFFSSNRYKPERVVSNLINIEVSSLPSYQGQGKFSGLVGRFDIEGAMDKTSLKAGESATLTIKISGSGNIMDASLPEIDLTDASFKVYDDNPVETIHLTETGYDGVKIFKKAIVPVQPGKYVIKQIPLVYFDVDSKAYQTVLTDEINLDVMPSEEMHLVNKSLTGALDRADNSVVKQEVALVNKDILEIKEGLEVLKDDREINFSFFVLLLLIPGILFTGVKLFIMVTKKDLPIEKIMAEKAKYHFKQAQKMGSDQKGFLGHLYSSQVAFIMAKGKRKGEAVTIKEAQTILRDVNVENRQIDQITQLLETIESVRFGGKKIDENKASQLLSKTKQILKLLCFALICLGVFSFAPQKAMADPTTTFIDGINAYKTGQFKQAAEMFEAVVKTPVKTPYLFYNIANAYLKANDIGHAVLWYERAKILAPNDPDLKFNLEYANTFVKDKKETSVNLMEVLFFWDHLISAKTIQIIALFFSFVFFTWAVMKCLKKQRIFSGIGIILCSMFILVTAIACMNYYRQAVRLNAVIVQEEAIVRSGTAETSTKLFTLHAGTKVSVKEQRDGYLKIVFSKDKIGWVKTEEAIII